jgi:hypothetical protein
MKITERCQGGMTKCWIINRLLWRVPFFGKYNANPWMRKKKLTHSEMRERNPPHKITKHKTHRPRRSWPASSTIFQLPRLPSTGASNQSLVLPRLSPARVAKNARESSCLPIPIISVRCSLQHVFTIFPSQESSKNDIQSHFPKIPSQNGHGLQNPIQKLIGVLSLCQSPCYIVYCMLKSWWNLFFGLWTLKIQMLNVWMIQDSNLSCLKTHILIIESFKKQKNKQKRIYIKQTNQNLQKFCAQNVQNNTDSAPTRHQLGTCWSKWTPISARSPGPKCGPWVLIQNRQVYHQRLVR